LNGPTVIAVGLLMFAACAEGRAQTNSLFGGSGAMSGSAGMGTASPANNTAGFGAGSSNAAFPNAAFPSSGTAGAGATGMGAAGLGQSTTGGMGATGQAGQAGRFVGQSNSRFVGMAAAAQQPAQNLNRNQQNRNANRNRAQNQNQNQASTGANNQRTIRPRLTVSFDYPEPTMQKATTAMSKRFEKLSKRAAFKGVTIDADGGRVTLRGEVDSAETGRLAVMMTRLEPGVRSVLNELTVTKAPAPESATE
jgi:osmotically-inducible protein OsmY